MGILWKSENNDLHIIVSLADKSKAILKCLWFQNLKIELDFGSLTNCLTWEVEFNKSEKGIWHILFDFGGAPPGFIELDCNEINFEKE